MFEMTLTYVGDKVIWSFFANAINHSQEQLFPCGTHDWQVLGKLVANCTRMTSLQLLLSSCTAVS